MVIGNQENFAFVLGKQKNNEQRVIDIWVKNTLLTDFDNLVHIPQFIESIHQELEIINSRKIPKWHSALNWGPTTDDFVGEFTVRNFEDIQFHCKNTNGKKITLNIKINELVLNFEHCINELEKTT